MEPEIIWATGWVLNSLVGGLFYEHVSKRFTKNQYTKVTQKALAVLLQEEAHQIVWNTINEKWGITETDLIEEDASHICSQLPENNRRACEDFFAALQKEYLKQLCTYGKKDTFGNYVIQQILRLDNLEGRIARLEKIYPEIVNILLTHQQFLDDRVNNVKTIIKAETPDIGDFVGREDIISSIPDENVYIQGNAAMGKTYLLLKLCAACNGYYIPLEKVHESAVFEILIQEAMEQGKRVFLDDFQSATDEISAYVQSYLTGMVIASREKCRIQRPFHVIQVGALQKKDIRAYFYLHNLDITDDVLHILEDDLGFPIKLRIFVHFLQEEKISILTLDTLRNVFKKLGIENFQLPDELSEFYEIFVFNHFNKKQKNLCNILSLLRNPTTLGRLSGISNISEGEISELVKKMEGILTVHKNRYYIFHDSFREYCISTVGDVKNLHNKIGLYFENLIETDDYMEGIIEAMYHYRISGRKSSFKRVFTLPVVNALVHIGLWNEARKNLEYALTLPLDEQLKADTYQIYGIVLYRQGEWDRAIEYYEKSLKYLRSWEMCTAWPRHIIIWGRCMLEKASGTGPSSTMRKI
ncbi:MAG: tetratricopeptide repeat protein [Theionarchaea archaeon]|nr:tetratricopeptide repeat protein [Theionarchaea archaeon]